MKNKNRIVKLTRGDTIIGEVVAEDNTHLSIIDPLQLDLAESDDGNLMMMAMHWIPLTKPINVVTIKNEHVVAVADSDESTWKYYQKSLAVFKGDLKKLKALLREENVEVGDLEMDENVVRFPSRLTANTVH